MPEPMSLSRSQIEQLAPQVLSDYGFVAGQIEYIQRLPQRVKNVNFRVRAGEQDWVLKCHTPAAAKRLEFPHELELSLAASGYPVAQLQRSRFGDTLVERDGVFFTLHTWVDGRQVAISGRDQAIAERPALTRELGEALGTLHRLGEPWVSQAPERPTTEWLLAGPSRTVTSIRRGRPPHLFKALRLRLRADKSEFDRWILERLPGLYRHAGALAESTIPHRADDLVVAHNDLNWENLIFAPSLQLLAVLDFDNATVLPRVLDLGAAAAVLAGGSTIRLDEFLTGYAKGCGEPVDRELAELGMRWKCVRSMLWSIDAYLSGRVADPALVATWCRHLDECLQAVAGRS